MKRKQVLKAGMKNMKDYNKDIAQAKELVHELNGWHQENLRITLEF